MSEYKKLTKNELKEILKRDHVYFGKYIIDIDIIIEDSKYKNILFLNCILNAKIEIRNTECESFLEFSKITIANSSVNNFNSVQIENCKTHTLSINNIKHESIITKIPHISVDNCEIGYLDFIGVDLIDVVNCKINKFYSSIKDLENNFYNGHNSFINCDFNMFFLERTKTIAYDTIIIMNCKINDYLDFNDININYLVFHNNYINRHLDFKNSIVKHADSQTFRELKNYYSRVNNKMKSLYFFHREMKAYEKEKKPFWDWILVYLNKLSSNHGISWSRGVLFTSLTGIIFFMLYHFTLENKLFDFAWNGYLEFWQSFSIGLKFFIIFFFPGHQFDFMNNFNPSGWSYFFDLVGRIFISYGIYQTIQSFRKYGKL